MSLTPEQKPHDRAASAVASVSLPSKEEHCVTVDAVGDCCLQQALDEVLSDLQAAPLQKFVFGGWKIN